MRTAKPGCQQLARRHLHQCRGMALGERRIDGNQFFGCFFPTVLRVSGKTRAQYQAKGDANCFHSLNFYTSSYNGKERRRNERKEHPAIFLQQQYSTPVKQNRSFSQDLFYVLSYYLFYRSNSVDWIFISRLVFVLPGSSFARPQLAETRRNLLIELFGSGYCTVSLYLVTVWYFSPGFRMVEGNEGLLGESGKCCVSRHRAPCCGMAFPSRFLIVASRKLPE